MNDTGRVCVFLFSTPMAAIALLAIVLLREVPLLTTVDIEQAAGHGTGRA